MADEKKKTVNVPLTEKQKLWAKYFVETGNQTKAAQLAGYKGTEGNWATTGSENRRNPKILEYMEKVYGWKEAPDIADGEEVLRFYTRVMRGEEKDAFGLDTGMADRLKAANALDRIVNAGKGRAGDGVSATGSGFQLTIQPVYGAPPADDDEAEEGDGE